MLPEGKYLEFNFSPSGQWAAYAFDAYRTGQVELDLEEPPHVVFVNEGDHAILTAIVPWRGREAFKIALSAVIEERDGTKSYWALAHPPGKPDFHHPTCFAATLPPPSRP